MLQTDLTLEAAKSGHAVLQRDLALGSLYPAVADGGAERRGQAGVPEVSG